METRAFDSEWLTRTAQAEQLEGQTRASSQALHHGTRLSRRGASEASTGGAGSVRVLIAVPRSVNFLAS